MTQPPNGIAIIGMACMFPGAPDLDTYWRNILGKVDAVSDPPVGSWNPEVYYDPSGINTDTVYCKRGGYLDSPVSFDPLPYGVPPVAVGGEPDQWLALKLAQDAMVDAGCLDLPEEIRRRTAVVLGKGTYLNGGNALAVEHSFVIGQTLRIIKQLNPDFTDEQLEQLRQEMKRSLPQIGPETVPGLIPNITVGRIANRLDLMGPTYTIDAACASSLVAVQLALRDLNEQTCDLALVGGAQVCMPIPILNIFCQIGALSRSEQIRPFDKDADGTLLGEGIGMVVLKRLSDAERDGDRIYAVIRGVGVASDGRGMSVMAPRVGGEELALRRAYDSAGISPETIELIEAHGTATPVGDVVELQALSRVFGPRGAQLPHCALGTVKSMISHTIPAAGIAGLIKTSLALYHKVLPPTLNVSEPNPKLELESSPFYINTEVRPWIHGRPEPRRAGINAFGFGGINAHVIVEEYEPTARSAADQAEAAASTTEARDHLPPWDSEVLILAGRSIHMLRERAQRLAAYVDALVVEPTTDAVDPVNLADLAFSVNADPSQSDGDYRLAIVASSLADLAQKLARATSRLGAPDCRHIKEVSGIYFTAEPLRPYGKLAFMFPGEGSQYPQMLADLCLHFPEVRACFDRTDETYAHHPRGYVLSDFVFPRPAFSAEARGWAEAQLMRMDGAVESVLTANQAMLGLVQRLGLRPDACVGHSTGEYSAMYASGILELETDEQLARFSRALYDYYDRAKSEDNVPTAALLALAVEREQAQAIASSAGGDIALAMDNCPHQAVLVGTEEAAERALEIIRCQGLIYERLAFDRAYHTQLFAPYAEQLRTVMAETPIRTAQIPAYSCTTAAPYPPDPDDIRALSVEHWATPVEFRRTVERLYADGFRIFVEVGARGNLTTFVEDILRGRTFSAIPANVQRRSGITQLNHLIARLAIEGVELDLAYLYAGRRPRRVAGDSDAGVRERPQLGTAVSLFTAWPTIQLPEDILHQIRPDDIDESSTPLPTANQTSSVDASTPVDTRQVVEPPTDEVGATIPAGPDVWFDVEPEALEEQARDEFALSNQRAEVAASSPDDIDQDSTMSAFLHTMDQFLSVQAEVMQAYLSGDAAAGFSSTPIEAVWANPSAAIGDLVESEGDLPPDPSAGIDAIGSHRLPDVERFPLLGEVVSWTPGAAIACERWFDLDDDHYLRHHAFGRAVSSIDVDLPAFVVMPMTMSLEIMAEAATALIPERSVVGLCDVRANRWLACNDQPQLVRVSARRLTSEDSEDRVLVEVRNLTEDAEAREPQRLPIIEAVVVLADAFPTAPVGRLLPPDESQPSRWLPEQLYRDAMFHGPLWQCVTSIARSSEQGSLATLQVLAADQLIRSRPDARFVLDPVILDGAGQVFGYWAVERLTEGAVIFPVRLSRLDIFSPQPPPGSQVSCVVAIKDMGHQRVRADIELIGPDGRLWMNLADWEDKRFYVPSEFNPLLAVSRYEDVSTKWPEPIAALADQVGLRCRQAPTIFPWDQEFWKDLWAYRVLSRRERERFQQLTLPPSRQIEWLAARTAAKDAVRALLEERFGMTLLPADVEISEDEHGRPVAGGAWTELVDAVPAISLTHTHGRAAALVHLDITRGAADRSESFGVGIDLERPRELPEGFEETAFDAGERALLADLPENQQLEWTFRSWCAKEAVAKALGRGMIEGPRSLSVVEFDTKQEYVAVQLNGALARLFPELVATPLVAHTCRDGDFVAATVANQKG